MSTHRDPAKALNVLDITEAEAVADAYLTVVAAGLMRQAGKAPEIEEAVEVGIAILVEVGVRTLIEGPRIYDRDSNGHP